MTDLRALVATPEPPELGPGPRSGVDEFVQLSAKLGQILRSSGWPRVRAELVRATIFLWHDYLDAAHAIVQEIEDADGSYVHAILHRREPDYGNAKYWFRRVGKHPCYSELALRIETMLQSKGSVDFRSRLIANGSWDAPGFVDACETVKEIGLIDDARLLREVQRTEFEVLLEYLSRS